MVIRWTKQAVDSLKMIYQFYLPSVGRNKALKIISSIRQETNYLLLFPQMGQVEYIQSESLQYRYIVKDHCKIYYTIHPQYIRIAFVWDTRQDPKQLAQYLLDRK